MIDLGKIIKHYVVKSFLKDIGVIFILLVSNEITHFLYLVIFLTNVKHLFGFADQLVEKFDQKQSINAIYELIKLLCYIILMIHYFGCFFVYIGIMQIRNQQHNNWMMHFGIDDSSIYER